MRHKLCGHVKTCFYVGSFFSGINEEIKDVIHVLCRPILYNNADTTCAKVHKLHLFVLLNFIVKIF